MMRLLDLKMIKKTFTLLPKETPRKLIVLGSIQFFAVGLDIIALAILAILSKAGLEYIQGTAPKMDFFFFHPEVDELSFESQFTLLSILALFLFAIKTALSIVVSRKTLTYLGKQSAMASEAIIESLFNSKPNYVLSKNTQELMYGVTVAVDSLVLSYLGSLTLFVTELLFLVTLLASLLLVQPLAGISSLLLFGASGYLINRFTASRARSKSEASGEIAVVFSKKFLEILSVYRELLLRGKINEATKEIRSPRQHFLNLRSEIMFLPILSKFLFEFVFVLGVAIVAVSQLAISDARTSIASVVVFLGAASRMLPSIVRLQGALMAMKQSEGSGKIALVQIEEFITNRNPRIQEEAPATQILSSDIHLEVKDLYFEHASPSNFKLKAINFSVKRGEMVAVVGESGSGKSTLADLILGIQEPTSGSVTINGVAPQQLILQSPGTLAYVPQDISIIDGDFLRNIFLIEDGHRESAERVLKKAALWKDIVQMRSGLKSIVGERGTSLSGGQRQRLGIARALYSEPELVVFDEATSSLDPITENTVTNAIYKRDRLVTLIVIAHRLSTVKNADLVVLLDKGQLVAKGSFDEVRSRVPKFDEQAKLVNL